MKYTKGFLDALFSEELHAARVQSLANGVVGVLSAAVLSVAAIGTAYALVAGTKAKSGIKQIDRLLSNKRAPSKTKARGPSSRLGRRIESP